MLSSGMQRSWPGVDAVIVQSARQYSTALHYCIIPHSCMHPCQCCYDTPSKAGTGGAVLLGCWACGWVPAATFSAAGLLPADSPVDQADSPSWHPTHEARDYLQPSLAPVT